MSLMLTNHLRRRRRAVLSVIALFAVAGVVVAGAALSGHAHDDVSDAATLCITAGMCVAVSAGVVALRRPPVQPRWQMAATSERSAAFVPVRGGVPARAGPLSVLQVFRL